MNTPGSDFENPVAAAEVAGQRASMKWLTVVAVSLPAMRALVDVNMLHPVARYMAGSFSATPAEIHPAMQAYGIASVLSFLPLALGERRIGRKALLLACLAVFTLASVLCGLATTPGMLLVFRVGQGVAGGGLLAATFAILCELFFPAKLNSVVAAFGIISLGAGPILGPSLGGYVTDNFTWRWIFLGNLPLGVVAFIIAAILVPSNSSGIPRRAGWDWKTIALTTVALASWNYLFGKAGI
jgi:DHA2 family multidrug resistance protein